MLRAHPQSTLCPVHGFHAAARTQGIEDALYDTSPEDQLAWLHSLHVRVDQLLKDIPALKLEVSGEGTSPTPQGPPWLLWSM